VQDRFETELERRHIEHREPNAPKNDRFIINLHSLHNPHLIRQVLPRDLVAPVPLIPQCDRQEYHQALAEAYKEKITVRKKAVSDKRKAAAESRRLKESESQRREDGQTVQNHSQSNSQSLEMDAARVQSTSSALFRESALGDAPHVADGSRNAKRRRTTVPT
jgi:hypothetical protein